jgi:AcrR family transcriptional regulator
MTDPAKRQAPQPENLPPATDAGHGLSERELVSNQRLRLFDAVAATVSETGYGAARVEDFLRAAGISRRTFYDNFRNKEEAYLAAFDHISAELISRVSRARADSPDFAAAVVNCLREFLGLAVEMPHYTVLCIVDVKSAGLAAVQRHNAILGQLAELLQRGAAALPGDVELPQIAAEGAIGGVYQVVYTRIVRGELETLPALLPGLSYLLLVPYIGQREAMRTFEQLRAQL